MLGERFQNRLESWAKTTQDTVEGSPFLRCLTRCCAPRRKGLRLWGASETNIFGARLWPSYEVGVTVLGHHIVIPLIEFDGGKRMHITTVGALNDSYQVNGWGPLLITSRTQVSIVLTAGAPRLLIGMSTDVIIGPMRVLEAWKRQDVFRLISQGECRCMHAEGHSFPTIEVLATELRQHPRLQSRVDTIFRLIDAIELDEVVDGSELNVETTGLVPAPTTTAGHVRQMVVQSYFGARGAMKDVRLVDASHAM